MKNDLLVLSGHEVAALLEGRDLELIQIVQSAYETHAQGESSLPHSVFLRFPFSPSNRIIALPAYLGGEVNIAGVKWISSFPGNLEIGLDRASAVLIINSSQTGRPEIIAESSIISAKRTAASAALAARCLQEGKKTTQVGFIGCGLINFEVARFLLALWSGIEKFVIYDVAMDRSKHFENRSLEAFAGIEVAIVQDVEAVLNQSSLVSIATTSLKPYIADLSACSPDSAILHLSLRDLEPEVILACDNIVDDIDHVCRAQTSIHLAEQKVGHRDFIRCTLADILIGKATARNNEKSLAVFSPFGLGILDISLGKLLGELALKQNCGTLVKSFLPEPWVRI